MLFFNLEENTRWSVLLVVWDWLSFWLDNWRCSTDFLLEIKQKKTHVVFTPIANFTIVQFVSPSNESFFSDVRLFLGKFQVFVCTSKSIWTFQTFKFKQTIRFTVASVLYCWSLLSVCNNRSSNSISVGLNEQSWSSYSLKI